MALAQLDADAALKLHDVAALATHRADARRRAAVVLAASPGRRVHRPLPAIVVCESCSRGFRPGTAWLGVHGCTCADCIAPIEGQRFTCSVGRCEFLVDRAGADCGRH
jgi:hypothetical protein